MKVHILIPTTLWWWGLEFGWIQEKAMDWKKSKGVMQLGPVISIPVWQLFFQSVCNFPEQRRSTDSLEFLALTWNAFLFCKLYSFSYNLRWFWLSYAHYSWEIAYSYFIFNFFPFPLHLRPLQFFSAISFLYQHVHLHGFCIILRSLATKTIPWFCDQSFLRAHGFYLRTFYGAPQFLLF